MWMCSLLLSLSKYHVGLSSPFLWWCKMIKCLREDTEWGEWHRYSEVVLGICWPSCGSSEWCRRCDAALGFHWPSDNSSDGRSSAPAQRLMGWLKLLEAKLQIRGGGTTITLQDKLLDLASDEIEILNILHHLLHFWLKLKINIPKLPQFLFFHSHQYRFMTQSRLDELTNKEQAYLSY